MTSPEHLHSALHLRLDLVRAGPRFGAEQDLQMMGAAGSWLLLKSRETGAERRPVDIVSAPRKWRASAPNDSA